jgi:hypothetical protein
MNMTHDSEPRLPAITFGSNTWIVLTRTPRAFGPFANSALAKNFAACHGGIALTWHVPHWVCEGCPPDYGAVWFNNDWTVPMVVGPFYDCDDVVKHYPVGDGIAVELDEFPDSWGGGGGEALPAGNDNGDACERAVA